MKFWHVISLLFCFVTPLFSTNHLLISELQVSPDPEEFIEIFNPNPFFIVLDSVYIADYNTYYNMVNGNFTTDPGDFLVKFPNGTTIDSAGVLVIATDGSTFSGHADFELKSNSAVPDMVPLYLGTSVALSNREMVILFFWNGESDLVADLDYAMWGDNTANFIDKSGISIDGPDADSNTSTYLDDTPVADQQQFPVAPLSGKSMARIAVSENGEIFLGGNGLFGHNETSEPINQNFAQLDVPTPGATDLQIPSGNGSGLAYVIPDSAEANQTLSLQFVIRGTVQDNITDLSLTVPASWNWTGISSDVQLNGPGFNGAIVSVNGNTILIGSAQVSVQDSGIIAVDNLTAPDQAEESVFEMETAVAGGSLTLIAGSPAVTVWALVNITPIADIQANPSGFTQVTIEGIVVLGSDITTNTWTDAYVQDTSGAGINIYRAGEVDPGLVRGNKVRISGSVSEYLGVTEIIDYTLEIISTGNSLPDPLEITTEEANNTALEGTFVEVSGEVTDFAPNVGGGTNIRVNDGSGECLIRVWDSAGLNLGGISVGTLLRVQGPLDIYQSATQLLLAYQNDFTIIQSKPGDGSGTASVAPDSVNLNQSNVELVFTLTGQAGYTLESVSLTVPADWQWSGSPSDVSIAGAGFMGAQISVNGKTILLTQSSVNNSSSGEITVRGLTSPNKDVISAFVIKTATAGGILTVIASPPTVTVGKGVTTVPISDIQLNTSQYEGKSVTIDGIVVLGAGISTTGWTDTYVQDNSGYGINVYQAGTVDNRLQRGNRVLVTGTVSEYQGTTEIIDYTLQVISQNNPLPTPLQLTTAEATDVRWEGVYVQVEGIITDEYSAGGGTNILVDDGSGACLLRIWDTAGLNLNAFAIGDTVIARGAIDIYSGSGQVLVGYQDDIFKPTGGVSGDGSGFAILDRDTISPGKSDVSLTMSIWSSPQDTLRTIQIIPPSNWGWTGLVENIQLTGRGFSDATAKVVTVFGEYQIQLTGCAVTATDSGNIALSSLQSPVESVYSYFWVKTAVQNGIPLFIASSPFIQVGINPIILIRDIQINSAQFKEPVTIQGVVTVGSGILRTDRTSAYMQDESEYGINISQSGAPDPRFQKGFYLQLVGAVSEYRQTTQITPTQVTILDSSAQLPAAIPVSTAEANNARWDGTLIRVPRTIGKDHAVVIEKYTTATQPPFDYNIVVNDGSGALTLRVWGTTGINLDSVLVNEAIIASGVGSVFISGETASYQILPAYQSDILPDPTYQPSLEGVALDVPPNPFVPDRGETIKIRYNAGSVNNQVTIRIFDLGGRMITTLLDKQADLLVDTVEWDGRNELLDFVPLGTYLCHLEVMEYNSGKKQTRVAPVVIGTVLKK
jgi:predicted extracellular nuclease